MSTQTLSYTNLDMTGTANLRVIGSAISAAITATGLTKYNGSAYGSIIDWTTVTTSNTGTLGYEYWTFNDTLATTRPLILQIRWGVSSGSLYVSAFATAASFDSSGNGIGNAQGYHGQFGLPSSTGTMSTANFYFNYNATRGFFGMHVFDDGVANNFQSARGTYTAERACDATGDPTTSGWLSAAWGGQSGGAYSFQVCSTDASATYTTSAPTAGFGIAGLSSYLVGTAVQFRRITVPYPTWRTQPGLLIYRGADLATRGDSISLSPYGTARTYLTVGPMGTSGAEAGALLWE